MNEQNIKIDEKKVFISPELTGIFEFLMRIDKEVLFQIKINDDLQKITNGISELLTDLGNSGKILKENKIDFKYSTTIDDLNNLMLLSRKTNFICSQMICLFAYMETISCIMTVYHSENKFPNEKLLIEKCNDDLENFIKKYILNDNNEFYKENISRFSGMGAKSLIKTRNALTHFYSVGNRIGIIPKELTNHYKKIKKISNGYNYICPEDFYSLLKGSFKIILEERDNDCRSNKIKFNEKMTYVTNLVKENAAVEMKFTKEMLNNL